MKVALLSLGSKSSQMTLTALNKYFEFVDDVNLKEMEVMMGKKELQILYRGQPLENYDCIYAKGSFRYAPLLRSVTTAFYQKAYMPITANAFTIGHDKLLTHLAMQYHNIPMPGTYVVSSIEAAKKILQDVTYPIILKFPQGTQGKGVLFADSYASASSILDAMDTLKNPFLIQEYIETGGTDIRAFVVGNSVVAAMKRKAVYGEKRANIHAGASGESLVLDASTKKIALQAAKCIGADICAVDILESVKGPQVIEANLSPGLQGITDVTGIDVADKVAMYLRDKTRDFLQSNKETQTSEMFSELKNSPQADHGQQIVTNLDFRGDRILLPGIVTKIAKFHENAEIVIKAKKGAVTLEKF